MPAVILVVCTANIARSPLAEALLHGHVHARGLDGEVVVRSAGVQAEPGNHAARTSQRIAERWGFDLSAHRAHAVSEVDLADIDLVLAMTAEQRDVVSARVAGLGARCFTVVELSRLLRDGGSAQDAVDGARQRIASVVRAANRRRPHSIPGADEDVMDPYGYGDDVYVEVANQLAGELAIVADALLGPLDAS